MVGLAGMKHTPLWWTKPQTTFRTADGIQGMLLPCSCSDLCDQASLVASTSHRTAVRYSLPCSSVCYISLCCKLSAAVAVSAATAWQSSFGDFDVLFPCYNCKSRCHRWCGLVSAASAYRCFVTGPVGGCLGQLRAGSAIKLWRTAHMWQCRADFK
jgi:hypothetical protein